MDSAKKKDWKTLAGYLKYTCSGSGPAVFAYNVLAQGWCSTKQFETMKAMLSRLEQRRRAHEANQFSRKRKPESDSADWGVDFSSSHEEMAGSSYGEY